MVVATGLTPEQTDMLLANTGLIGFVLNRKGKHLVDGIYSEADAWQDGVFGLARAVQKYDPDRGFTFSTYALPHIFQAIQRGRGRTESTQWRRMYEAGESAEYVRPLSLDAEHEGSGGGVDGWAPTFVETFADPSADTEGDAEAAAVFDALRAACRDPLDHAVLDAMLAGAGTGPMGPRFGVSAVAAWRRADRLRGIGARLLCEQVGCNSCDWQAT